MSKALLYSSETLALRTIRAQNWKWSKIKATKHLNNFIAFINKNAYQVADLTDSTYFVMPGYEHVTRNQPIAKYNITQESWEIGVVTLFENPKK